MDACLLERPHVSVAFDLANQMRKKPIAQPSQSVMGMFHQARFSVHKLSTFSFTCGNRSLDLGVHLQKDARMRWPQRNLRLLLAALEEPCRERWTACRRRGGKQLQTPPRPRNPRESETH